MASHDLGGAVTVDAGLDLADPGGDLRASEAEGRYEAQKTLGEGGMGEVLLCRDRRMGREVAMKLVHRRRCTGSELDGRFLREARVQAQLEHPAIVPVYDLAKDGTGRTFFTMRRVRGATLEVVIARLACGHAPTAAEYTRHKLLAAYARVCLAVDFAHARGVVHRDLKPANVMLGDFGEVYVLDWGVAKIDAVRSRDGDGDGDRDADRDSDGEVMLEKSGERLALRDTDGRRTEAGVILGTPAYMAPEQLRGKPVDARTDVYALGAILFEILTYTSLHDCRRPSSRVDALARSQAVEAIPPELNAIWRKATSREATERHASARELHDEVEAFLSGDRDLTTRKLLVAKHLAAARLQCAEPIETVENRSRALAELGSAIALDPTDVEARRMLVELLSTPPQVAPPEVVDALERADEASRLVGVKKGVFLYTLPILLFFLPATLVMGLRSFSSAAACFGSFLLAGAVSALAYKRPHLTKHVPWVTVASSVAIATTAALAGIYVLLPTLAVANTTCHAVAGRPRHRPMIIAFGIMSMFVPVALELLGLVPPSHAFADGRLVLTSHVLTLSDPITPIFLAVVNVGLLVFAARSVGHYRDALGRAELRQLSQLWQLRQLVPEPVRAAASEPPPTE